jgi:glycerol-3-phosphate dehydrogenase
MKRPFERAAQLASLKALEFEVLVVGGGATGLGIAVDAASRGYRTALIEAHDFAKATSSRSTKLVHGGVRYLAEMHFSLVTEALEERAILCENAPHLVHDLAFIVPKYHWWEGPFYGTGLKLYDALAGKRNLGKSRSLSREETICAIPGVREEGLLGGIEYHDAQFDDARMALALAKTATDRGASVANRVRCVGLVKEDGQVVGAEVRDEESGETFRIRASIVVNATGVFADSLRRMDDPQAKTSLEPSRGTHLILPRRFLPANHAIMVPHTDDGRVLFVIPWHGHTLVGTTDTPMPRAELDPQPTDEEIDFILANAGRYLQRVPQRSDVLASFAGQRPLVHPEGTDGVASKKISREHVVETGPHGLVSVMGGKWTTYRKMAEDGLDEALRAAGLKAPPCRTETLQIFGAVDRKSADWPAEEWLEVYGSEAGALQAWMREEPSLAAPVHAEMPCTLAALAWGLRHEQARNAEDLLLRRIRMGALREKATRESMALLDDVLSA